MTARPPRTRRPVDPAVAWARSLRRRRPGLVEFVIERLGGLYGVPVPSQRLDPVSELVLTILSQNTADLNSERAFEALRATYPSERAGHRPSRRLDPMAPRRPPRAGVASGSRRARRRTGRPSKAPTSAR